MEKWCQLFISWSINIMGLPRWHSSTESAHQCRRSQRHEFYPWVRKISWSRKWQHAPVFLPGKFHGKRSLVGHSPWGCRVRHNWVTKCTHTLVLCSSIQAFSCHYCFEMFFTLIAAIVIIVEIFKWIWSSLEKINMVTKKLLKKCKEGGLTHGITWTCNIKSISMQLMMMLVEGAKCTKLSKIWSHSF